MAIVHHTTISPKNSTINADQSRSRKAGGCCQDNVYTSYDFNKMWLKAYANNTVLSRRETEVLLHVAQGDKNEKIALDCCVSPQTVKCHISSIMRKLAAKNRTHAAVIAISKGWIIIE